MILIDSSIDGKGEDGRDIERAWKRRGEEMEVRLGVKRERLRRWGRGERRIDGWG